MAELVEHLARALQQTSFSDGLNPAQWSALRFIARANPRARTVTGLASAMMTTKSTTSQTVSALKRKRLIEARPAPDDRRLAHLTLTRRGRAMLEKDPLLTLVAVLEKLPADGLYATAITIEAMVRAMFDRSGRARPDRPQPTSRVPGLTRSGAADG